MKVLLLAGGDSSERNVSLSSGEAVMSALAGLGHTVLALDPATGGRLLPSGQGLIPAEATTQGTSLPVKHHSPPALAEALGQGDIRDTDVVFIALHGGSGENGRIQCLLELAGKRFTGSGMLASALAMNKATAKRLFAGIGVTTPGWKLYPEALVNSGLVDDVMRSFDFPLIVKPNDGGSTIGLTKVTAPDGLEEALREAANESPDILVEEYIEGREMTVALLDGEPLPVVEIKPANELYDYEAKYTKGKSRYVVPAEIDEKTVHELQQAAKKMYAVLGAAGLARADFILEASGTILALELNTLPGMTELSLAPMAAKHAGLSFEQLVHRILRSAGA